MGRKKVERVTVKCVWCGVEFEARAAQINRGRGKFCSRPCANAQNGQNKADNRQVGEEHYRWKGGTAAANARRMRDRIKENARYAVYSAVKRGRLVRMPCAVCGLLKSEAHHKDYTKPLEVEWLCRKHHREADLRDGTKAGDFGH